MVFQQKTILKSVETLDVIRSFHTHKFVEYLTFGQPVKIENWRGIDDGKTASFSFWFFGWRKISVVHKHYTLKRNFLYFVDEGRILPFGIKNWQHHHTVKNSRDGSLIIDKVILDHDLGVKKYFIYPIMLFPIIIRKVTYKVWFYLLEGKSWKSFKN
tara:strand:+ start:252 stop:722 length:471 start_codon:yes stop_codon:yes gene_type:complete